MSDLKLWTLIKILDTGEYDAVPNVWITDKKECYYPDPDKTSTQIIESLAAKCVKPHTTDHEWIVYKKIEIVQSDYTKFSVCCGDMVRKTKDKRLAEESAEEIALKKRRISKTASASAVPSSQLKPQTTTNQQPQTTPLKTIHKSKKKTSKSPPPASSNFISGSANNSFEGGELCPCKKDSHECCCAEPTTLENIAKNQCLLSRRLFKSEEKSAKRHSEIVKIIDAQKQVTNTTESAATPVIEPRRIIKKEDVDASLLNDFPLTKSKKIREWNERLKSQETADKLIATIITEKVTKKSLYPNFTGRNVISVLIGAEKAGFFTWDGKPRNKIKKFPFKKLQFYQIILEIVKYHHHPTPIDEANLKYSLGQWFSQTANKMEKLLSQTSVTVDSSQSEIPSSEESDAGENQNPDPENENAENTGNDDAQLNQNAENTANDVDAQLNQSSAEHDDLH
ncbi:uncharacterized protein [Bemisia tabaci]|uniref:uncharacterized protein isoform X2 n=1 Tax=Bemisia tabaci TaxID=7038 RepID=UPI003B27FC3C